jgi:hypothetical protein
MNIQLSSDKSQAPNAFIPILMLVPFLAYERTATRKKDGKLIYIYVM